MEELRIIKKIMGLVIKLVLCFIGFLVSVPFTMFMTMEQKTYFSLQSIKFFENLYHEISVLQDQLKEKATKKEQK